MQRLAGKVAIVTGGANGMGEATVRTFVENGAKVVIGDIAEQQGQALADELGDAAVFLRMDVTSEADWAAAVAAAEQLGTLNVLVNNAAILHIASITDTTPEDYMRVVSVNQLSAFLGIRAVIPSMKAAGVGSIINVSSIDGLHSQAGLSAYSSTKWALRGLTKSAAIELGQYNIRVNTVHPGGIFTQMGGKGAIEEEDINRTIYNKMPIPRVGQPEEVAAVTLFLATNEASYSTGSEFVADGGWFAGQLGNGMPTA
ncbi:3-alpha-hydroxysteroid dehydrogenase [Halioglobus japonicus]|uniref:3-oxoacyl-ACP reductase n=1 Tax=Halioglobus japonicus TaxID=930805 RepID=A0AAP8SPD1_9GAMM|nr:glucose 1-dehydrogenase [Halioglobus japonicus]AQA19544.1 3-alpha-hydroxysteroid dehydrogenase [Halioglobus japonicus]PLW87389.1 3-oxoacyl-ACP reductase [Halioglobus japonicus]GHD08741.1 3-alpha-hydroxysteroid dehydrogenase [Halioglobus japonicus]